MKPKKNGKPPKPTRGKDDPLECEAQMLCDKSVFFSQLYQVQSKKSFAHQNCPCFGKSQGRCEDVRGCMMFSPSPGLNKECQMTFFMQTLTLTVNLTQICI